MEILQLLLLTILVFQLPAKFGSHLKDYLIYNVQKSLLSQRQMQTLKAGRFINFPERLCLQIYLIQCVSQHKYDLHDYYILTTVVKIPTVSLTSNFEFMKFIDVFMLLLSDVW